MELMPPIQEFQLTIKNDTVAGQEVQERIVRILEEQNYPPRDVFGIRLALEEALVNAIKHGNGMDPNKKVRIDCRIEREKVRIVIEDEGEGFEPESIPDPTAPENLEKPCGRGLMLMRSFMNNIEYNDVGNRVTLEKHRAGPQENGQDTHQEA